MTRRAAVVAWIGVGVLVTGIGGATSAWAAPAYRPKIYLGGPDVFYRNPKAIAQKKKKIAEQYGFEGVFPLDNDVPAQPTPSETGLSVFKANVDLMRKCDLMVANMTPFRGPSMDVGTSFEMGFMMGLGKPVLAYSDDPRGFTERTSEFIKARGGKVTAKGKELRDSDGNGLENFGLVDNLMLEGVVRHSGARVETSFEAAVKNNAKWLLEKFKR